MTIKNAHHRTSSSRGRDQRISYREAMLERFARASSALINGMERVEPWVYRVNPLLVIRAKQAEDDAAPFRRPVEEVQE